MNHRASVGIGFIIVTLAFMAGFPRVEIRTIFKDLLPKNDPFVQIYFDHPNFGNPLTVSLMVKAKNGDIYNAKTLNKVWELTREVDLAPKVDHDTLISISTEKLRYAEATPDGVDMRPLMESKAPTSPEDVAAFRQRVASSPNAQSFYVSRDETATLITVAFHDSIDYGEAFTFLQNLVEKSRDADHDVYIAGQPILTGWVYKLQKQTYSIFSITIVALIIALFLYMRNVAGVVTPIICSAVAGIWGFGLSGGWDALSNPC